MASPILRLPKEQLIRIPTAARLLCVGDDAVRALVEAGTLMALDVGDGFGRRRWRIVVRRSMESTAGRALAPFTLEEFVARRMNVATESQQTTFNL